MGKHSSKEAYFKRLQELAEVKKPSLKESTRTIGNLINYKRGADGVAYGIVKENHHYYIKKGGIKENLDASDFTYIGGLGNITEYQYSKLSEADKNRNMILNMINESYNKKISKYGSIGKLNKKRMLSENVDEDAEQEIEQAEEKLDDLEVASQKAAASEPADAPDMGDDDMPDLGGEEEDDDMPDLNDLELDDETPEDGVGDETSSKGGDVVGMEEYEKYVGKLQQSLRELPDISKEKLEDTLKQVLSAYKDKLSDAEISIEDRKEIAKEYLINVDDASAEEIPDVDFGDADDEENVIQMIGDSDEEEELPMTAEGMKKNSCNECGSFVQYAESRGYTSESIIEASVDEMTNLTAGYIQEYFEGNNEGDVESVSAHLTNESFNKLKEEYGFDENQLADYEQSLNEMDGDQRIEKINELWSGKKKSNQNINKKTNVIGDKKNVGVQKEGMNDTANVKTQPTPTFAAEAQVLGVGINENEEKIKKYVRGRLQEMMGIKKMNINENAKSDSIKKLDKIIERQFKLYENVIKKKI